MGKDHAFGQPQLVPHLDFLGQAGEAFDAHPVPDLALPGDYALFDEGAAADDGVAHDGAVPQPCALLDGAVGADHHVWADLAALLDYRTGVDHHVARRLTERLDFVVGQVGSLSDQVIGGPSDIEPEVVLEWQAEELALLGHLREDLLLDHAEPLGDAIEHRHVEQVDAGVDLVADEVVGLLHEGVHSPRLVRHDDPEPARILNRGEDDGALSAVLLVELLELLERVVADNIAVEHEEQALVVILPQDVLGELERAGSAERNFLLRVGNLDIVLLLERLEGVLDVRGLVVDGDDHLNDPDFGERLSDGISTSI